MRTDSKGLPIGLQLIGDCFQEKKIIRAAYAYEQTREPACSPCWQTVERRQKDGKQYETVIGLEVHVELATKTKIFCGCCTEFGGAPNTHTCPVCTGMPGSLPVLNKQVVEYAIAVGLATNCRSPSIVNLTGRIISIRIIHRTIRFPSCICQSASNGGCGDRDGSGKKKFGIHEIHMEEDAGKLVHDEWEDCSLVDYNRCGVPLIEIVSEPDMRSADEVIAYLEKLRLIIQYLGASDCKLQEGSMRADVNLSVREVGAQNSEHVPR